MEKEKRFLNVGDVCELMECSQSKAYCIIKQLNGELEKKGYLTMAGKVNTKYFFDRFYGGSSLNECKL